MTREEAINVLKTRSCYECSWGCDSPVNCHCGGCDLAEATSIAIESLEAPRWIPVTERLPEKEGLYLISHQNGKVFLDKWLGDDGWDSFISVKAWMPLPEPYGGGDAE